MKKYIIVSVILFQTVLTEADASIPQVDSLLNRLEEQNREIYYTRANLKNQQESLKISESLQYPNVHLTGSLSKGKELALSSNSINSVNPAQLSQLGVQFPTSVSPDGWIASLNANYYLFTRYAITDAIESSRVGNQSAQMTLEMEKTSKKSHLLQVLMEWKWLRSTIIPLEEARELSKSVKKHSESNANLLYTESDRTDVSEKITELEYNFLKAEQALKLAESALKDLIPDLNLIELEKVPNFDLKYEIPTEEKILGLYQDKSLSHKIQNNDVAITQKHYESVRKWSKPWIPIAMLTSNYYKYGQYTGSDIQDGWSVGLVFNFDLYDAGLTTSQTSQAQLAYLVAKNKREDALSKHNISLTAERAKARISQAEYDLKLIKAKKKKLQLLDIIEKKKKGLSTKLEITLASLDYAKSQLEALDAYKSYQSASLGIAVELNEWDKVKIYETK